MLAQFCESPFLGVALLSAGFFGLYGLLMTWVIQRKDEREVQRSANPPWAEGRRPWPERLFSLAQLLFQFWFNAAGGVVGWIAVWFLWLAPFKEYGWTHLVVFIVAFVGVTGNLPYLSTGIREALAGAAKRVSPGRGNGG
jgi:hypothetical protein